MLRVQVHAVIWVDGKLVVHRSKRHGRERVSLPGGRVKLRESVPHALRRKVLEETGVDVDVGNLLFGAEAFNRLSLQDVILVFEATLADATRHEHLDVIDPAAAEAASVLPPVVGELIDGEANLRPRWLGNVHLAQLSQR